MLAKLFYAIAGFILLLLGLLGLIVPILPGVVFLFLAIVCFARVSSGLQAWIDSSHRFKGLELKMRVQALGIRYLVPCSLDQRSAINLL